MYKNKKEHKANIIVEMIVLVIFSLFVVGLSYVYDLTTKSKNQIDITPTPTLTIEKTQDEEIKDMNDGEETEVNEDVSDTYGSNEENDITNNETDIEIPEEELPIIEEVVEVLGYTTENLNVRTECNTDSEILDVLPKYTQVYFQSIPENDEWVKIQYNEEDAYLSKAYIKEGHAYEVKSATGDTRKSYMDWKAITRKTSLQWKLQHNYASTNSNGIRVVNGRYCIAMGSYYTHDIGRYVDVVLENGKVLECIVGDAKQDRHTSNNHSIGLDGGVVEFVVDTKSLPVLARRMGDVSYISDDWKSNVVEIRIYYKNLFDQ